MDCCFWLCFGLKVWLKIKFAGNALNKSNASCTSKRGSYCDQIFFCREAINQTEIYFLPTLLTFNFQMAMHHLLYIPIVSTPGELNECVQRYQLTQPEYTVWAV